MIGIVPTSVEKYHSNLFYKSQPAFLFGKYFIYEIVVNGPRFEVYTDAKEEPLILCGHESIQIEYDEELIEFEDD